MTDDRAPRGRRLGGLKRLTVRLIVLVAGLVTPVLLGALAGGASGAGGVPIGTGTTTTGTTTGPTGTTTGPTGTTTGTGTTTTTPTVPAAPLPTPIPVPTTNPFAGRAMWIWELPKTDGGSAQQIGSDGQVYGLTAVYVKSSDGAGHLWSQFNPTLVQTLHAYGLKVCAWQYVYGAHPIGEATLGAQAVKDGADCLVIDAESEYQGRYVQAQQYITQLRKLIGQSFPVGLAGFPYVDYHPGFPYSIFLGVGGAQYNLPQMYWKDIGTSVDNVYAHTFRYNAVFQRPIFPLGQLTGSPSAVDVTRFRQLSVSYGATGISWWDWQEANANEFTTISQPLAALAGFLVSASAPPVHRGSKGDMVVWAQEHLVTAGNRVTVDGDYGPATQTAVTAFQLAKGLSPTGIVDSYTWNALLSYQPAFVHWWLHFPKPKPKKPAKKPTTKTSTKTTTKRARAAAARNHRPPTINARVPLSASLPMRRNELAGH